MKPTELQDLLDREGVPMEARAAITLRKSGEYEDGAPAWFSDIGTEVPDDLAELAHVGAMVRWLMCNGKWMKTREHEQGVRVSVAVGELVFDGNAHTLTEALAHTCGRIAKEKA